MEKTLICYFVASRDSSHLLQKCNFLRSNFVCCAEVAIHNMAKLFVKLHFLVILESGIHIQEAPHISREIQAR